MTDGQISSICIAILEKWRRGEGLHGEIERQIAAYLSKEENLHDLRIKLLNLEGYRRQSEVDKEWEAFRAQSAQKASDLEQKHREEMRRLKDEQQEAIRKLQEDHEAEVQQARRELTEYQAFVKGQMEKAACDQEQIARWQSGYSEFAAAYAKFSALSLKHREAIAGIFGGCDTPMEFFCGALQRGHLEQLWDYVSDELAAADAAAEEAARLAALFDFSFASVNSSQREPLFRRLHVPPGAAFDGDAMSRTASSPQLGRVARLLFAGFSHAVTGSVVRRSLVELA